jgi:hypothetical protein
MLRHVRGFALANADHDTRSLQAYRCSPGRRISLTARELDRIPRGAACRPVRTALDGLQQSLEPTQFDPSKAVRKFRIAVDNYSAVVRVGILAARIGEVAPNVLLEFQPSGTPGVTDEITGAARDR